jgi:hypothetical protein
MAVGSAAVPFFVFFWFQVGDRYQNGVKFEVLIVSQRFASQDHQQERTE